MKRITSIVIFIILLQAVVCCHCAAQDTIKKVIDNGDDASRFVFVVIAEGYTAAEMQKFDTDCQNIMGYFFSSSPWNEYRSFINVYSIFTPSNQSGADIPSEDIYVDTAFDASFDSYGISQLLTVNDAKAFETAAQVPTFDAVFILVNDTHYGGSGGATIVLSTHPAAGEIALHESGHLIAHLADEYDMPYSIYPKDTGEPNITLETEREKIPWNSWIDADTPLPTPETITDRIGLFEGADYSSNGIYRPKHDCKMRQLGVPYCQICTEALVRSIYNVVNPIDSFGPAESEITVSDQAVTLWIEPVQASGSDYEIRWELDGKIVSNSQLTYVLQPNLLESGTHTIRVWLKDTNSFVRVDTEGLLTSQHTWAVHKNPCSGTVSGTIIDAETDVGIANAQITFAASAQSVHTNTDGVFRFEGVSCGSYSLVINAPGFEEAEKECFITEEQETAVTIYLNKTVPLYSLSGTIMGKIPEGSTIKLYGTLSATAQTTNQLFTFTSLPAGLYVIIPEAPGYSFFPAFQLVHIKEKNLQGIAFFCYRKLLSLY